MLICVILFVHMFDFLYILKILHSFLKTWKLVLHYKLIVGGARSEQNDLGGAGVRKLETPEMPRRKFNAKALMQLPLKSFATKGYDSKISCWLFLRTHPGPEPNTAFTMITRASFISEVILSLVSLGTFLNTGSWYK